MTRPVPDAHEADADALARALRSSSTTLLVAHVSPDADTLGSALALGLALHGLGLPAVVSLGEDPLVLPRSLAWLPGVADLLVPPGEAPARPDVAVALDSSSRDRLGVLAATFDRARLRAVVDHHPSYTGFGDLHVVDPHAPATALLALDLVDRLGAPLTAPIATCLYTGLITDTGSFRFAGTGPSTHLVAARLLAAGVRPDHVARRVYGDVPLDEVRLTAAAISRAVLEPAAAAGLGLVHTAVGRDERQVLGLGADALEPVAESLRAIAEAEVAAVLKQGDDGDWRVSLRSSGAVDVGSVAVQLGGGGHLAAGGFTAPGPPEDVLHQLRLRLDAAGPTAGP